MDLVPEYALGYKTSDGNIYIANTNSPQFGFWFHYKVVSPFSKNKVFRVKDP